MPRPTRSYGRPGTRVIPAGWEASHAPVAEGTMTATVALRKPGSTEVFNETTGQSEYSPLPPYAAGLPSRIQAYRETAVDRPKDVAEETIRVAGYLVTLPLTQSVEVGDLVDVTAGTDTELVGKTLRVIDLVLGSLRFERDVYCTIND